MTASCLMCGSPLKRNAKKFCSLRCNGSSLTANRKICNVELCQKLHEAKGYCRKHYSKIKKYGDPLYGHENEKHGLRATRAYNSWAAMKNRCLNPENKKI